MPKLLYLLLTADCTDNPFLTTFDNTLRSGLSSILDLSDIQWLQACLPVRHGALSIKSAAMLAPSAFFGVSCIDARPSAVNSSGAYQVEV